MSEKRYNEDGRFWPDKDGIHIPIRFGSGEQTETPAEENQEKIQPTPAQPVDWEEKYKRLYAELENTKKRLARNYANQARQEKEQLLRDLLAVIDNLERALAYTETETDTLRQGIELTLRQFQDILTQHGVQVIEAEGQPFNPELHEAIGTVSHQELPEGTVAQIAQKGYLFHDKLLRPARVLVVTHTETQ
ncbi:MAG: nucleotide exchange factor GrpE [Chloroflexi bacterium]|nr:MAG: nucleotide exchange factor GrpE [Chloroflexota bacterium]